MRLVHFSDTKITEVQDKKQRDRHNFKPIGFWVSDEDEEDCWSKFCKREYESGLGAIAHDVALKKDANILWLKNPWELDDFTDEYRVDSEFLSSIYIDWQRVAEKYDGIMITPYQYMRRHDFDASSWYYPWDVASGCIWNAKAIEYVAPQGEIPHIHKDWSIERLKQEFPDLVII